MRAGLWALNSFPIFSHAASFSFHVVASDFLQLIILLYFYTVTNNSAFSSAEKFAPRILFSFCESISVIKLNIFTKF
jgi:hypothetical protein